jgi:hypothetical protein
VCRAHTGRLYALSGFEDVRPRLCARCTARLSHSQARGRRATQQSRRQTRDRFEGLTLDELTADLACATTEADVDQVLHVALLLHGVPTVMAARDEVARHRARVHVPTAADDTAAADIREHREAAAARGKADRKELHQHREARIASLGIRSATSSRGAPLR